MSSEEKIDFPDEIKSYALESGGTPEKAIEILSKSVKDCLLIKLYVDLSGKNGFLFFIISEYTNRVISMYSVLGTSPSLRRINPYENFSGFVLDLEKTIKSGGIEEPLSERVGRAIFRNCSHERLIHYVPNLLNKITAEFLKLIEDSIKDETKLKSLRITMDIEKINSIDFYEKNALRAFYPSVRNPFIVDTPIKSEESEESSIEIAIEKFNQSLSEYFKGFNEVLDCRVGISPSFGIELYRLKEGQPIYFTLPTLTDKDRIKAKEMDALDQKGKIRPIIGKYLTTMISPKGEHHILALSKYESLLHAIENNQVKVSVPSEDPDEVEKSSGAKNVFLIFLITILVLGGLILSILLK